MPAKGLTPKQRRFVAEYGVDLNATQAAIRAGYAKGSANVTGCQLLANPNIAHLVAKSQSKHLEVANITAERVMQELGRLAFANLPSFYREDGSLKSMGELTPEQGAALAGVETMQRNVTAGDGETETVYKVKLWDKPRSLDTLVKVLGMVTEKVEHSGEVVFTWQTPAQKS
jgi:phage terminase small subunit